MEDRDASAVLPSREGGVTVTSGLAMAETAGSIPVLRSNQPTSTDGGYWVPGGYGAHSPRDPALGSYASGLGRNVDTIS